MTRVKNLLISVFGFKWVCVIRYKRRVNEEDIRGVLKNKYLETTSSDFLILKKKRSLFSFPSSAASPPTVIVSTKKDDPFCLNITFEASLSYKIMCIGSYIVFMAIIIFFLMKGHWELSKSSFFFLCLSFVIGMLHKIYDSYIVINDLARDFPVDTIKILFEY